MDSNNGGKLPSFQPMHHHGGGGRHHHHHHHHRIFYVSPHCSFHRPILQPKNHTPSCSFSITYPQNLESIASAPLDPQLSVLDPNSNQTFHDSLMIEDGIEKVEDDDEDEDPIFVLTDEWRDFFAKSEAKRRLAKKQARKGKK